MLGRCCEVTGAYTFKGLAERAFGRRAGIAIQCVVLSYTTGTCIAYVIFAGEFCQDFFAYCAYASGHVDAAGATTQPEVVVFTGAYRYLTDPVYSKVGLSLFVLLPICLVRDLHMLRHTSTLAVICIMYTTGEE
jgi:amino acid permease